MRKPGAALEQLSNGQRVEGTVRKITDFGAFVDLGLGRDGMVHISDLRLGTVEKVSDVVQQGQQITAWVKNVDSKRNRINLTLVDPGRKKVRDFVEGASVQGTVTRLVPYGAFVDIGAEREAMLHVKEMSDGYVKDPSDVLQVGDTVDVRVLTVDRRRRRIDLTMKQEAAETPAEAPEPAAPESSEDVPTLMELRLRQALEQQGQQEHGRERRRKARDAQDEKLDDIIARTLQNHRSDH